MQGNKPFNAMRITVKGFERSTNRSTISVNGKQATNGSITKMQAMNKGNECIYANTNRTRVFGIKRTDKRFRKQDWVKQLIKMQR